jgi:hypothetical protein
MFVGDSDYIIAACCSGFADFGIGGRRTGIASAEQAEERIAP